MKTQCKGKCKEGNGRGKGGNMPHGEGKLQRNTMLLEATLLTSEERLQLGFGWSPGPHGACGQGISAMPKRDNRPWSKRVPRVGVTG